MDIPGPTMRMSTPLGIIAGVLCVTGAIVMGSPLSVYFDVISAILVGFTTLFLLVYTYGISDSRRYIIGGWSRMIRPEQDSPWYDTDHAKAARIAKAGIAFAMLSGTASAIIGFVQMLQSMADPNAIGPAMAVAMLCPLYSIILSAFGFAPLVRFHSGEARGLADKERDAPLAYTVGLVWLALGLCLFSFFVMLLAMTDFGGGA